MRRDEAEDEAAAVASMNDHERQTYWACQLRTERIVCGALDEVLALVALALRRFESDADRWDSVAERIGALRAAVEQWPTLPTDRPRGAGPS